MSVYFKKIYTVYGEVDTEGRKNFTLQINMEEYNNAVLEFNLELQEKKLNIVTQIEVSQALQEMFNKQETVLRELHGELIDLSNKIHENAHKFINHLKYSLNQYNLDELSLPTHFYFSLNNTDWIPITMGGTLYPDTNFGVCKLNDDALKEIQTYFQSDIEPLLAMKHLHRAKREVISRYKWIETTIALELAIKEVLIRKNPDIKFLLLELPSPPLEKLYNHVFNFYFNVEIPKKMRKIVIDGAMKRNKLVHSPQEITIGRQEAINYVYQAEELIYHVLKALYPDDYIVDKLNTPNERGTAYITIFKDIK
jgi:hypothetical protein